MSHRRRILRSKPAKDWRTGEPPIIIQPCRVALMRAIREQHYSTADAISRKSMRKTYSRLSKPALVNLLSRMVGASL